MKRKYILIFGASSGICEYFIKNSEKINKFDVILTCRSKKKIHKLKEQLKEKNNFNFYKIDASKEKEIIQLKKSLYRKKIFPKIIINFCGDIGEGGKIVNLSSSKWETTLANNLKTFFYISKHFIPLMLKVNKPLYINFSGGGGLLPQPTLNAYSASKAAIVRLIENISLEFKKLNIIAIAPGAINTKIFSKLKKQKKKLSIKLKDEIQNRLKDGGDNIMIPSKLIDNLIDNKYNHFLSGKIISAKYDNLFKILNKKNHIKPNDLTLRRVDKTLKIPKYL